MYTAKWYITLLRNIVFHPRSYQDKFMVHFSNHMSQLAVLLKVEQTEFCQIFHSIYNISLYTPFCVMIFVPRRPWATVWQTLMYTSLTVCALESTTQSWPRENTWASRNIPSLSKAWPWDLFSAIQYVRSSGNCVHWMVKGRLTYNMFGRLGTVYTGW